jgi:hypothetical protein
VGPGNHGGCDFALVVKRKLGVEWHEDDAFVSDVVDRLQVFPDYYIRHFPFPTVSFSYGIDSSFSEQRRCLSSIISLLH